MNEYNQTEIIKDYLISNNLQSTYLEFIKETSQQKSKILIFLKNNDKPSFLNEFNRIFNKESIINNPELNKLDYMCNIYFTIYPVLNEILNLKEKSKVSSCSLLKMKENTSDFTKFLNEKEADYTKTNDTLSFYSFPYVNNPLNHHFFSGLFTKTWRDDLFKRLKTELDLKKILFFNLDEENEDKLNKETVKSMTSISHKTILFKILSQFDFLNNRLSELESKSEQDRKNLYESQIKWSKLTLEIIKQSKEIVNQMETLLLNQNIKEILLKTASYFKVDVCVNVISKLRRYENFVVTNLEELKKANFILKSNSEKKENNHNDSSCKSNENKEKDKVKDKEKEKVKEKENPIDVCKSYKNIDNNIIKDRNYEEELRKTDNHILNSNQVIFNNEEEEEDYVIYRNDDELNENTKKTRKSKTEMESRVNISKSSINLRVTPENKTEKSFFASENKENPVKNKENHENDNTIITKSAPYNEEYLLNFIKIKEDLIFLVSSFQLSSFTENEQLKLAIKLNFVMREIRIRLSRKKNFQLKQYSLYAIIYYDLFNIRTNSKFPSKSIYDFLIFEPTMMIESLKLLNTISNESKGRSYLLEKEGFIKDIVSIMKKELVESEIRQNCIGIIQKLTLKYAPQLELIELNIIYWIVMILLNETKNISEYSIEYGLALLMNLSLNKKGRDKCEEISKPILMLLINYINSESVQIRTCVNGTLYSLIKRKSIREVARKSQLESILIELQDNSNDQMNKQIEYILDELKSEENLEEGDLFDDDNQYSDEEDEGIDDDYVSNDYKYII